MLKKPLTSKTKINDFKKQVVGGETGGGGFYSGLREEQRTDQTFVDDTFKTVIKDPYRITRTGAASRLVDSACDAVDTSSPQVFCEPKKETVKERERANKRALLLNHWVKLLSDEITESKKNNMLRGEAFGQVEFNENYDPNDEKSLPIIITAPDPMIMYPDPHEVHGVPRRHIKHCSMNVSQVEQMFPDWSNPKSRKTNDITGVNYSAYWDAGTRYIEADKEAILGPQKNIFGFVPIAHCVSGFGKRSPDGKPESRVVGRLRKVRNILTEQCESLSRINSQHALFTDPVILFDPLTDSPPELTKEQIAEIEFGPGKVIPGVPGWKVRIYQGDVPGPQMYQHLYQIDAKLGLETPNVALGIPSTSRATGRQEDIYSETYSRKYRTFKKNLEGLWSTLMGMGLRIAEWRLTEFPSEKITVKATIKVDGKEKVIEETITAEDIGGCYDCRVEFKQSEALVEERNFVKYSRLAGEGRISWETLLIKGMGYTQEDAKQEIDKALEELAWRTNPALLQIVMTEALERAGREGLLRRMAQQAQRQIEMSQAPTPTGGGQRPSEARNPTADGIMRQVMEEGATATNRERNFPQ